MRKFLCLIALISVVCVALVGCNNTSTTVENKDYCMVTFVNWNGAVIQKSRCVKGQSVHPPVDPTREEDEYNTYDFAGWDKDLSEITENTTVTATYTANHIIRVNLWLDGELYYSKKYQDAVKDTELPTPKADGKEFDSWYTGKDFSRKLTVENLKEFDPSIEVSDLTFYGRWKDQEKQQETNQ